MNIYFICPVRKLEKLAKTSIYWKRVKEKIEADVENLEKQGHIVRYPRRDTEQDDEVGLHIVEDHEDDIIWADQIRIWWYPKISEGSYFDYAQTRAANMFLPKDKRKQIVWMNIKEQETDIMFYAVYEPEIMRGHIEIYWHAKGKDSLWRLAQARMAKRLNPQKKIVLKNFDELEVTPKKSYANVAIATHLGLTANTAKTRQDLLRRLEVEKLALRTKKGEQ